MCKHILNAQVAIRAPCCKAWFDCPQCHQEKTDHELRKTWEITFACKKCKKVFRRDMREFEEADEFCPHCDNHFVIPMRTPATEGKLMVEIEGDSNMFRDDREKQRNKVGAMDPSQLPVHGMEQWMNSM